MLLLSPPQLAGRVLCFSDHTCSRIAPLLAATLPRLRASHCFRRLTTHRSSTPRRLRLTVLPPGASFDLMRPLLVWPDSSSRWLMGFCISLSAFAKSASCLLLESPSARVRCPHHRFARQSFWNSRCRHATAAAPRRRQRARFWTCCHRGHRLLVLSPGAPRLHWLPHRPPDPRYELQGHFAVPALIRPTSDVLGARASLLTTASPAGCTRAAAARPRFSSGTSARCHRHFSAPAWGPRRCSSPFRPRTAP